MIGQKPAQREEVKIYDRILAADIITDWSVAIDGGAHVGTWSDVLAERFQRVIAFEPTEETFGYLTENMAPNANVECRNEALMDSIARVDVHQPRPKRTTLTARFVRKNKAGDVRCVTIDSLGLTSCGLIKLDLEGAEALALAGASKTIKRCKPVLVIEIGGLLKRFGVDPEAIHKKVLKYGYRETFRSGVDRIYAPI